NERLQSYEFTLDAVGNVTAEKGFDGAVRRYLRDRGGRVVRETLPSGTEREYGYDACSRVTRVSYPTAGDPDQTYTYGLSGRLVQASRGESTVEFAYNSLGLPTRETADGNTILRTYDHTGRILTLDSTAGASLRYTRNGYGELEGFTATGGSDADGTGSWESAHRHDTLGFEVERILPGGVVRSFAYDDIGRLVDARTRKDSRTRHMRRYRWGVADRLLSVEDSRRGETRYSYTPTGQLERAEYPDGRVQWRKSDQTGNLYPDPDMKLRRYLGGGRLEQDGEWHCEYDADGNLTERYLGTGRWLDGKKDRWRYRWNADGSLAKVVRPDKREVEFTYDALGRRLSKSFGTTVTRWVWNGNVPLHQWKQHREYSVVEDRWNTDTERRDMTVWLFDEGSFVPVAMIKEGRSYSILTDQLGTPTEAYDTEGNEVWSRVLDMDGNVIEETGNKGMIPFLFQGQYYDRETGLAYNRFRYYSPKMGMYVSQDPIGLGGGILNLYGYVDDTNVWIDSFGLDWNYVLINSKGNVFYSGRASDNANLSDVARRHAGTKGADGTRFGNGDTLVQITKPQITSYAAARGVEQFGIMNSSTPLLGYRSTNVRGNKIAGISSSNRNIEIYMSEGESVINGKTLADMIAKGKKMTFEEYQTKKTYKK
uniref:RHS repeat domain-containing protein n=1 Tax=Bacteroides fragilis TaxID=817 RepID=UPI00356799FA